MIKKIISNNVYVDCLIPGFDANKNGLVVKLRINAFKAKKFRVQSNGEVATALKNNFIRAVYILSSINESWSELRSYHYIIKSVDRYKVMDARSAGLPLCVTLLNIIRDINGLEQVSDYIGTGILRIDGSFEESSLEEKKKQAVQQSVDYENTFVDSGLCRHVFDLVTLMNYSKPKGENENGS